MQTVIDQIKKELENIEAQLRALRSRKAGLDQLRAQAQKLFAGDAAPAKKYYKPWAALPALDDFRWVFGGVAVNPFLLRDQIAANAPGSAVCAAVGLSHPALISLLGRLSAKCWTPNQPACLGLLEGLPPTPMATATAVPMPMAPPPSAPSQAAKPAISSVNGTEPKPRNPDSIPSVNRFAVRA